MIRLMTLNLRTSDNDDGANNWFARWPHIKALLLKTAPNVFAAQECMRNQLFNIMGDIAGYFPYAGPDTMIPASSIRNPFFVCHPCDLPIRQTALALNDSGVIGQVSWGGWQPRLAHILRFKRWAVVNTHFDPRPIHAETRLQSARLLVDHLKDDPQAIIMGDLNCESDSQPINVFKEAGFVLAKDALPAAVDRRTFHKFTGAGLAEYDYVLVRGGKIENVMIPRPRSEAPYLSDHDPVVVDVTFDGE